MKLKKGFTLIELLVVIAIIAILATLAVVAYSGAQTKSRDSKRVADVNSVVSALASVNQDGMYVCSACTAAGTIPAAGSLVSAAVICDKACGTAGTAQTNYINLNQIKDPKSSGTACTFAGGPPTIPSGACDYTFKSYTSPSAFEIGFFLEGASGSVAAGGHLSNQNGLLQ